MAPAPDLRSIGRSASSRKRPSDLRDSQFTVTFRLPVAVHPDEDVTVTVNLSVPRLPALNVMLRVPPPAVIVPFEIVHA